MGEVAASLQGWVLSFVQQIFRQVGGVVDQSVQQVGAGNDAFELPFVHDGDQPLSVFDDNFLNVRQGGIERQHLNVAGHIVLHRLISEVVAESAFHHLPGDDAEDEGSAAARAWLDPGNHHHRIDVVAAHQGLGMMQGGVFGGGDSGRSHHLPGNCLGPDVAVQASDQLLVGLDGAHIFHCCRGRGCMAATAEVSGDGTDIDIGYSASGDQIGTSTHGSNGEQHVKILHGQEAFDDQGEIIDVIGQRQGGNDHRDILDVDAAGILDQIVQVANLLGGEVVADKLRDDVEFGPFFQEPGGRPHIVRRGGHMGERTGVLIDAEAEYGGLLFGYLNLFLLQYLGKKGHRRADVADNFEITGQIAVACRVMIIEMERYARIIKALSQWAEP